MNGQERRARLRALFARTEDPYAGGDLVNACHLGAALWVIATALTWMLLPVAHPDQAIGEWGWAVAIGTTVAGLISSRRLVRAQMSWNELLAMSYVAITQIAVLEWLAGGWGTPFGELFLLSALYSGAIHPPRRVLGVLSAIAVASVLPLVYDGSSAARFGQTGLQVLLMGAVALLAAAMMSEVRRQRVALSDRSDRAEREARVDELTGLPNRRAFGEAVAVEIARAKRFDSPLSLVVADLDGFKAINDTLGHPAGDACLRQVADLLGRTLRQYDSCFRWGGDEFVLLLPETSVADAEAVCRRASAAVAASAAPDGTPLSITCAPARFDAGMTADDLVAAADAELLVRKSGPDLRLAQTA